MNRSGEDRDWSDALGQVGRTAVRRGWAEKEGGMVQTLDRMLREDKSSLPEYDRIVGGGLWGALKLGELSLLHIQNDCTATTGRWYQTGPEQDKASWKGGAVGC